MAEVVVVSWGGGGEREVVCRGMVGTLGCQRVTVNSTTIRGEGRLSCRYFFGPIDGVVEPELFLDSDLT